MTRIKLLIVDDDLMACLLLREFFSNYEDINVLGEAHNGLEAMDMLHTLQPDVLLLDMVMPVMDGIAVLEALHKSPPAHAPIVIAQTAMGSQAFITSTRPYNIYYYMLKPYDLQALYQRVLQAVYQRALPIARGQDFDVDAWIGNTLCSLGIPPNFAGFFMLRTGVKLCLENTRYLNSVTKSLYPAIAERHNSSMEKAERNMRHAIRTAWIRAGITKFDLILGYGLTPRQPSVGEFIGLMTERLEQRRRA